MAFTSAFFDAELVNGEYDRVYSAEVFAEYFASFIANGVFPDPATNLQVVANTVNDMNVLVSTGMGWINGYYCKNDGSYPLAIQAANGTLNRIDAVVIGWSQSDRTITAYVKTGVAASAPTAPSLERSADRYELMLATITVNAGVTKITQSMITDKRPDSSVCGWVAGVVQQIDATNLFAQYDDAFQTWFEDIQAQLSGDVATNLQNQINQLKNYNTTFENTYSNMLAHGIKYKKVVFQMRMSGSPVYGLFIRSEKLEREVSSGSEDLTVYYPTRDLNYGNDKVTLLIPMDLDYAGETEVSIDLSNTNTQVVSVPVTAKDSILNFTTSTEHLHFSSRISSLTLWVCGGGGSGAAGRSNNNSSNRVLTMGGSGGYTSTKTIVNTPGVVIGDLLIGAGGTGTTHTNSGKSATATKGSDGGSTSIVAPDGSIVVEAQGGKGGTETTSSSDVGLVGVPGGSGTGGIHATSANSSTIVGTGGSNGSAGATAGSYAGGSGQGTTTRPFGDSTLPLCCSAGGNATSYNLNMAVASSGGPGASKGVVGNSEGASLTSAAPTTPGSGSGACCGYYNGSGPSTMKTSSGADGTCYIKLVA